MKKSNPTTGAFVVPSLSDVDPVYKDLSNRRAILLGKQTSLTAERRDIERELGAQGGSGYSASVAALLGEGDGTDPAVAKRARLAEIKKEAADVEAALSIVDRRLAEQKPQANTTAVEACRAEYGRRVAAMVEAFRAVQAAREAYDELRDQFEREDIRWSRLGPMSPNFLGDARDGHVQRFIREAREAGYVD